MAQFITSPDKFAQWFNTKVPGAYREVTPDDIRLLTECGVIKRHGYYFHDDIKTIIGILNYEQLLGKRRQKQEQEAILEPPHCKLCGQPLLPQSEGKSGRPKEYCPQCEGLRIKERYRKWKGKRQAILY